MKKIIYFCLFIAVGCSDDDFRLDESQKLNEDLQNIEMALQAGLTVCDKETMPWLSELLQKAEEDRLTMKHNGQYTGYISVVEYKGSAFFYVQFAMGSGGIFAYLFDCDGNSKPSILSEEPAYFNDNSLKRNAMIYSTIDF